MDVPAGRENRKLLSRYSAGDPVYYKEIIFEKKSNSRQTDKVKDTTAPPFSPFRSVRLPP